MPAGPVPTLGAFRQQRVAESEDPWSVAFLLPLFDALVERPFGTREIRCLSSYREQLGSQSVVDAATVPTLLALP